MSLSCGTFALLQLYKIKIEKQVKLVSLKVKFSFTNITGFKSFNFYLYILKRFKFVSKLLPNIYD